MAAPRRGTAEARWRALAERRGALARALWPLSFLMTLVVRVRHALYAAGVWRSEVLPVPVIVVGNVVAGGAGKTPVTRALVEALRARGWRPGLISRGYGGSAHGAQAVAHDSDPAAVGDEPLLLHRTTGAPVVVARRRAEAGRALLAAHPDVNLLIADDGLQHRALHADLRIVVFDDRGVGNGWLLPAGLLREPWPPRGAQPVPDFAVWPQGAAPPRLPANCRGFTIHRALHDTALELRRGERQRLADLSPAAALAGIARPEVFFGQLRAAGVTLNQTHAAPDHADGPSLAVALARLPAERPVLCTEKDAVKLPATLPVGRVWVVPLAVSLPVALLDAVDATLAARAPRR